MSPAQVLAPFVAVANRMPFAAKFGTVFVLFAVPLLVFGGLLVGRAEDQRERAARELTGLEVMLAVRPLLEKVPEHRGMTNATLNGHRGFEARLRAHAEAITAALDRLAAMPEIAGLGLRPRPGRPCGDASGGSPPRRPSAPIRRSSPGCTSCCGRWPSGRACFSIRSGPACTW